jgi:hypothetical protein
MGKGGLSTTLSNIRRLQETQRGYVRLHYFFAVLYLLFSRYLAQASNAT